MSEKIISNAPDVQGLRVLVLSKDMEKQGLKPIQAGFIQSISGIKGGSRESQDLMPINDLDYEPIASVGQKKYSDLSMSILYNFIEKERQTSFKEGVNLLDEAFDKNEEAFIIVIFQDERKTTLKLKVKVTNFEIKSESNSKLSVDITCKKLGDGVDITQSFNQKEAFEKENVINEAELKDNENLAQTELDNETKA